ncbi:hypothetical protein [Selenomonas noxia]|jgi:hypothetical protein|uniref:hypothetical protein n=1 Tax=Selenomonas noxia TaxID=135083 RepID=UPI0028D2E9ED|nr:hypothetical protein [Selenomonas noxia]
MNERSCISPVQQLSYNVNQPGDKNINIFNHADGVINLVSPAPLQLPEHNTEQLIAIQNFSKDYYQLIVTVAEDIFTSNEVIIPIDQALTQNHAPSEIYARCSSLSETGIDELKTFPALICNQNTDYHGLTDDKQHAIYSYIKRIKKEGRNIKISFCPIAVFPQHKLCKKSTSVYFDLNMECAITDLNQSAWSVHKVNLFEAFAVADLSNMPKPY